MINNLARLIAIILSLASGTISVFGMASIFSGKYYETIAVMGVLECSKIVVAAWLQVHWNDVAKKIKFYLCFALTVLMLITSIGVYGFFSKAHIETEIKMATGDASQLPIVVSKIENQEEKIRDVDKRITELDRSFNAITDKAKTSREAALSLDQQRRFKNDRDQLRKERSGLQEELGRFKTDRIILENKIRQTEAEVGPIKYIANFFYGNANNEQLEHAVRWLIIVIMSVFDPLAVILIVASTIVSSRKEKFKFVVKK